MSIVIPALNEQHNIGWVLERLPAMVDEVILVDGYSTDRTVEIAESGTSRAPPAGGGDLHWLLGPSRAVLVCRPLGAGRGDDLAGCWGEGVGRGVLVAGDGQGHQLQRP